MMFLVDIILHKKCSLGVGLMRMSINGLNDWPKEK